MHVDLINAYTAAVRRARQEYADHPLAAGCKGDHKCAWRREKAARKAQRVRSGGMGQAERERRSTGGICEREGEK